METAFVKIWSKVVGAVAWDIKTGVAGFEYANDFKSLGIELSPIKMPANTNQRYFSFPELKGNPYSDFNTFKGLPGLLADVLPDRYGNQLINQWLSRVGRSPNSMNPVELLCFIGNRGMGALEFEPFSLPLHSRSFKIEIDNMVEIARKMLSNKQQFSTKLNKEDSDAMKDILKIGTSAGGARPKAVIAYNEKTGEVRSGQASAPKGFEHWLIKLDGVSNVQLGSSSGYGRVEMAYYNMATSVGIEMMPSRLLEENGRAHFMTMRFDREGSDIKHHIQTFCALNHFDYNDVNSFSYEQLFQLMRQLKLDYPAAEQMFRRMVFNVIARNCDDHTKNFSFRLKQNGRWELAPAYDICHAYKPSSQWVSQHALSINGKRSGITKEDVLIIGESIRCKHASAIINDIQYALNHWSDFASDVKVKPSLRKEIELTLLKL